MLILSAAPFINKLKKNVWNQASCCRVRNNTRNSKSETIEYTCVYSTRKRQFERELTETKKQHDKNNSSPPSLRIDTSPFLLAQNGHGAQLLLTWQETIFSFRALTPVREAREHAKWGEFLLDKPAPAPPQARSALKRALFHCHGVVEILRRFLVLAFTE